MSVSGDTTAGGWALLDLLSGEGGAGSSSRAVEIPPRVLAISVFALAVAAVAGVLRPESGLRFAGFLWILALVPAFLLSYYHGWTGAVKALAGGMVVLTVSEVVARLLLDGHVDWWVYGVATTALIAVSLGSGMMAELLLRSGGGAGAGETGRLRDIRRAVEDGQLVLHFQPIVSLETRAPVGVEALVRWEHPRRGLLDADEFVDFAEGAGMLVPIGNWATEEALRRFADWRGSFPSSPDFFVSVNVSTPECRQPGFVDRVRSLLDAHGVAAGRVQVEVSEETLDETGTQLAQIERLGVGLVIDDFGTGYVSLGQLARLRVDGLKIDGSFVARMTEDDRDRATVDAIARIGRALGLDVTAEAVETERQAAALRELGCDLGQGRFFAEPYPAAAMEGRLSEA